MMVSADAHVDRCQRLDAFPNPSTPPQYSPLYPRTETQPQIGKVLTPLMR